MNRRGFLSLLAPAAALIVAPELLIPKRTFFLPPAGGWGIPMTATEVLSNYRRYWDSVINPSVMGSMLDDLVLYGTSAVKFSSDPLRIERLSPGSIHMAEALRPMLFQ